MPYIIDTLYTIQSQTVVCLMPPLFKTQLLSKTKQYPNDQPKLVDHSIFLFDELRDIATVTLSSFYLLFVIFFPFLEARLMRHNAALTVLQTIFITCSSWLAHALCAWYQGRKQTISCKQTVVLPEFLSESLLFLHTNVKKK